MPELTVESANTVENGSPGDAWPKAAYISAPPCVDTSAVRKALESKGVQCFSPDQLDLPGQNLSQILREAMERADLIVAVVDPTVASNFVFYEVGFAQALSKPTIVLLMGDVPPSTWLSSGIPYFRFDPDRPSGLDFGITQILKIPHHGARSALSPSKRTHPLGLRADELLAQLRAAGDKILELELEAIIEQAIRESGVTTLSKGEEHNKYVNLAIWSNDLTPWVGNPLPIEIRVTLSSTAEVNAAVGQLVQSMAGGSILWGLLLYVRSEVDIAKAATIPNILHMSAEHFLEALRDTSFGDLIRRLRNERVHGNG
jgi:hypothetical protein